MVERKYLQSTYRLDEGKGHYTIVQFIEYGVDREGNVEVNLDF